MVKVLSTTRSAPDSRAIRAIASMSATRSVGFDTTSTRISRVFGRTAAAKASASVGSAKVVSKPKRGSSSAIRRKERP